MMILLIDNYDSFSYNLYQLIGSIDPQIQVIRNDEKSVQEISAMQPERIVLSPGPGRPEASMWCASWAGRFRSSAYAWGIRPSVLLMEPGSLTLPGSCMARRQK